MGLALRDRVQARREARRSCRIITHRHDLRLEEAGQRIRAAALPHRQAGILLEAIGGRGTARGDGYSDPQTRAALLMAEYLLDPFPKGGQDFQLSVVELSGSAVDQAQRTDAGAVRHL